MKRPDLRPLLEEQGLSVQAFATELGVSRQTVYEWLKRRRRPVMEQVLKISIALDVDVSDVQARIAQRGGD